MRFGISSKIFIGFVAVIVAFSASNLFSYLRTAQLRDNIVFLRRVAFPVRQGLLRLEESLRDYVNPRDAPRRQPELERERDYLPVLQPFRELEELELRISGAISKSRLNDLDSERIAAFASEMRALRTGETLYERFYSDRDAGGSWTSSAMDPLPGPVSNEELLQLVGEAFVRAVDEQRFNDATALYRERRNLLNDVWRGVKALRRTLNRSITLLDNRAESDERQAMLTTTLSAGGALVVALVVLILTQLSIRRLQRLIASVRRLSAGNYDERVQLRGADEISELGSEFNHMVESLAERDQRLASQSEELLRSERLATIGQMSAQITHEIRNPLSSIGLNVELLEEELLESEAKDLDEPVSLLRAIASEVDRLNAVTEQYLRFARLPKPHVETNDLSVLVGNLLGFVAVELRSREMRVTTDVDRQVMVQVDEGQVWQALLNIVRNAAEAMEAGGSLHVKTWSEPGYGAVSIADSGPGIPEDIREQVFKPFFSTKDYGTGLGLSLVAEIIREHDGELDCESEMGSGTTFVVRLPAPH